MELSWAYETITGAFEFDRDVVQDIDDGCEPLDQLGITISEFVECPGLLLECGEDRFRGSALINDGGDWVLSDVLPSAFSVLGQRDIEEGFKVGRCGCI